MTTVGILMQRGLQEQHLCVDNESNKGVISQRENVFHIILLSFQLKYAILSTKI